MIINSPHPKVDIPDLPLTPFVLRREQELHDRPAIINGLSGESLSYSDLGSAIRRTASGLLSLGVKKGDVVMIYSPNLPEFAIAFHAVSYIGAVVTTVNPLYTAEELCKQVIDANAKIIITIPELVSNATGSTCCGKLNNIIVFGEAEGASSFDLLQENEELVQPADVEVDTHAVVLPYSSGTTGLPKGVVITHKNLVANVCQFNGVQDYTPTNENDTLIAALPFFHIYGMNVFLSTSIYQGACIVTMPRFDLQQFLTIIQEYSVTRAYIAPPIAVALAKHPMVDEFQLSSLKIVFSGAAPLGTEISREVENRLGCSVVQGYGLTEASPVTNSCPNESGRKKYGSIGPPISNTEMKIIDIESGEMLGRNQNGEVCIRGPQVMPGYLNNAAATAACIDEDGWFHSGDIGYADEDGYFFIVDRVKELIKYKGYQVAPAELEALLLTHPGIADVAVIGQVDEECGELPIAFIVQKEGAETDAVDIMQFVADRVAPYKKIRAVTFTDAIPKAPSGKILRRLLRDQ